MTTDIALAHNVGETKRLRAGSGVELTNPERGVIEIAGVGGLQVVGPFEVGYAALDPVNYVKLGDLPDDAIVWRVLVQLTALFSTEDERVLVYLGKNADDSSRLKIADVVATADTRSTLAAISEPPAFGETFPFSWAAQGVGGDLALFAGDQHGSNSTGIATISALVSGG